MPRRPNFWPTAAVALTALAGCSQAVRWPNLYQPGTAPQQRAEALVHDPYPLDDVGPEIVGGRPLAYQRPVPEVDRARMFFSRLPGAGRTPTFAPAPAAQAAPFPYVMAPSAQPAPYSYAPPPAAQPAPYSYAPPAAQPAPYSYALPPAQPAPYPYSPAPSSQPDSYRPRFRY